MKATCLQYDEFMDAFEVSMPSLNLVRWMDAGAFADLVEEYDEPFEFVGRTFDIPTFI